MLRTLECSGELETSSNDDGSDKLYFVPGGSTAILVEVPDESAVHMFEQPRNCNAEEFHARIFGLFRHFSASITRPLERLGGEGKCYPRIGDDPDNLPDLEVMRQSQEGTKYHRHLQALEDNPDMLADLSAPVNRPSLNSYVGWSKKHTHQHKKLIRAIFVDAFQMNKRGVKKLEKASVKEIVRLRRKTGVAASLRKFAGASWEHKRRKRKTRPA